MSRRLTHSEAVAKANIRHDDKYEYPGEYPGTNEKWKIRCLIHGIFFQRAGTHIHGVGCPECGHERRRTANMKTHDEFLEEAFAIHGDTYRYTSLYMGNDIPMNIECPTHGVFKQSPGNHLQGQGCPDCGNIRQGLKRRETFEHFVELARETHGDRYQYLPPYITTDTKISIMCSIHGIFEQTPHNHLNGSGCPDCAVEERSLEYRKSFVLFVEEANIVHEGRYGYPIDEYVNTHMPISIKCPEHGIFKQMPDHHLQRHGCPKCSAGANVSKSEIEWLDSLNIPEEHRQKTIKINDKRLKVDALDPTINTIYEFYGDYWHGNPQKFDSNDTNKSVSKTFGALHQSTLSRETLIKQAGYNLVSIWESDWKHLKKENAA
jgi:ssDNA-binding Zn-finger/Zn-ribbon topoisomerase 1